MSGTLVTCMEVLICLELNCSEVLICLEPGVLKSWRVWNLPTLWRFLSFRTGLIYIFLPFFLSFCLWFVKLFIMIILLFSFNFQNGDHLKKCCFWTTFHIFLVNIQGKDTTIILISTYLINIYIFCSPWFLHSQFCKNCQIYHVMVSLWCDSWLWAKCKLEC